MKNGNRYSFNPRRKIIPQIVAMRTGKFGYTLIVHLASNHWSKSKLLLHLIRFYTPFNSNYTQG